MKHYKVTMDKEVRNNTISKSVTFFAAIIGLLLLLSKERFENRGSSILILCALVIIVFAYSVLYSLSPIEYLLTDDEIIIRRYIGNVSIKLNKIKTINIVTSSDFLKTTRTSFRNSGLFGFTGSYMIKNIKTKFYVKRKKDNILLTQFSKENIIISPDDIIMVIDLIEAIEKQKQTRNGFSGHR